MGLTIAAMPAYNEERSIARMVLGCRKQVDQVVVVDDGSSDATAEIAEALGAYVVRHETSVWPGLTTTTKKDCYHDDYHIQPVQLLAFNSGRC